MTSKSHPCDWPVLITTPDERDAIVALVTDSRATLATPALGWEISVTAREEINAITFDLLV